MRAGFGVGLDLDRLNIAGLPPVLELFVKRGGTAALSEAIAIITSSGAESDPSEIVALAKRCGIGPNELASALMANMAWETQHGEF